MSQRGTYSQKSGEFQEISRMAEEGQGKSSSRNKKINHFNNANVNKVKNSLVICKCDLIRFQFDCKCS